MFFQPPWWVGLSPSCEDGHDSESMSYTDKVLYVDRHTDRARLKQTAWIHMGTKCALATAKRVLNNKVRCNTTHRVDYTTATLCSHPFFSFAFYIRSWALSHMKDSCHEWRSYVTYEWVTSHMNEAYVTSHMNESYVCALATAKRVPNNKIRCSTPHRGDCMTATVCSRPCFSGAFYIRSLSHSCIHTSSLLRWIDVAQTE